MFTKIKIPEVLRKTLGWAPKFVRRHLFRNMVELESPPPHQIVVKLAETKEELESAYSLLHDVFVENGLMKPTDSGMRLTIYNALPSTSTIIVMWDGKVVGTASIVRDNPLGLPHDRELDLSKLKNQKDVRAEIFGLAVSHKFRKKTSTVLFPLLKYISHFCESFLDVQVLQMTSPVEYVDFYESLFFFEKIDGNIFRDPILNNREVMGLYCDFTPAKQKLAMTYGMKKSNKNIYRYLYQERFDCFIYPQKDFNTVVFTTLSPEVLDYFYNQKSDIFKHANSLYVYYLNEIYGGNDEYKSIIPKVDLDFKRRIKQSRDAKRYPVACPAVQVDSEGDIEYRFTVSDVSLEGMKAIMKRDCEEGVSCDFLVETGPFKMAFITASVVWKRKSDLRDDDENIYVYGLKIESYDHDWKEFISYLNAQVDIIENEDHDEKDDETKESA